MFKIINKIIKVLESKEKRQFRILICLMFLAMFLETMGIGSIFPLINYFTMDAELFFNNKQLNEIFIQLKISKENILNIMLIAIILIFTIKNLYLSVYIWLEGKFVQKVRFEIGVRLFKKYLNSPYMFHVENKSSSLMTKIEHETTIYGGSLLSLSSLLTEILVITGITIFLFFIRPLETLIVIFFGFLFSIIYYLPVRKILSRIAKKRHLAQTEKMQFLNQGLGAIKDIIIYKVQKHFINSFKLTSDKLADAVSKGNFFGRFPKIWFEITMMIILSSLIFYLSLLEYSAERIMSTLGIFLVSSVRIIPSINRIVTSLQAIRWSEPTCESLYEDLYEKNFRTSETTEDEPINFDKDIKFENVSFNHPKKQKPTLKNINLTIKKNEFIGIIGETGSGKSTFVDLLIGLMKPTSGKIKSDGKNIQKSINAWKRKFGYVPQNLYLLDDSILNNIAFGISENEISLKNVENSLKKSQLVKFIENRKGGLHTKVGERGVKVSGGEKQRIGIGRALYNDPQILVLDEATSALDQDTEQKILSILLDSKFKKTIVFISHRKTIIEICDKIFKVENNKVEELVKIR